MSDTRGEPGHDERFGAVDRGWKDFSPGSDPLPEPEPVVVRPPLLFLLLGVPLLAGLSYGLLRSIWMAVSTGNPGEPLGRQGWSVFVVVAWVVALTLLVLMLGTIAVLVSFRASLTTTRTTSWFLLRRRRTTVDEAASIAYETPSGSPVFGRTPARLQVMDDTGGVVASYSTRETEWLQVLANLREWVRARPELAVDDTTRRFFEVIDER